MSMIRTVTVLLATCLGLLCWTLPASTSSWELVASQTLGLEGSDDLAITHFGRGIAVATIEHFRPTQQLALYAGYGRYAYESRGVFCPDCCYRTPRGDRPANAFDFGFVLRGIESPDGARFREFGFLSLSGRVLHLGDGYGTDGSWTLSIGLGEAVRLAPEKSLILQCGVGLGGLDAFVIPISVGIQFDSQ